MDIQKTISEYDRIMEGGHVEEADAFLAAAINRAEQEKDRNAEITLLNEMVGLCRETDQKERGLGYCEKLRLLLKERKMEGSLPYADSLLNIATTFRVFGLYEPAGEYYREIEKIYLKNYPVHTRAYAGLYNNWSLLYQETGEYEEAEEMIRRALQIIDLYPDALIYQATSRTNLASLLLKKNERNNDPFLLREAFERLNEAITIFEAQGGNDYHYGAALSAMGDALCASGSREEGGRYYEKALHFVENKIGKNRAYRNILEKYESTKKRGQVMNADEAAVRRAESRHKSTIQLCREFYETYGSPMISRDFPGYENRIAVGLAGEGSECFGFDDDISRDHDYGIGFCMWLEDEDYSRIGSALQTAYQRLIRTDGKRFEEENGIRTSLHQQIDRRRGALRIRDFYQNLLEKDVYSLKETASFLTDREWAQIPESGLAAATNGEVFRDELDSFSGIRRSLLRYYPDKVRLWKLAEQIHVFSQCGQSNYGRSMARRDAVTAALCAADAMRSAMHISYLLCGEYTPYYKWMRKGMERLPQMQAMIPVLDHISGLPPQTEAWEDRAYSSVRLNEEDAVETDIEQIAQIILEVLNKQGLVTGTETFLDSYCMEIVQKASKM